MHWQVEVARVYAMVVSRVVVLGMSGWVKVGGRARVRWSRWAVVCAARSVSLDGVERWRDSGGSEMWVVGWLVVM